MIDSIYIFNNLTQEQLGDLVASIPVLSNGTRTVVFVDDFCGLDEALQEELLEYQLIEI